MKKLISKATLLCTGILILAACSTTKTASTSSVTNVGRGKFTGTWTVNSVTFDGIMENTVQSAFETATPRSFEGSTWVLSNSGNGTFTLSNGTSQPIFWSVYNDPALGTMFQFKKLAESEKAKDVTSGYRMEIGSADGNTMLLKTPVQFGGKTAYVLYSFKKNNF